MIVGIHQPNYLPWIGYFHKMLSCDVFVILDDVLCSQKNERRSFIKGANGVIPLSLPLKNKKAIIKDIQLSNKGNWEHRHFYSLQGSYVKTDYWEKISPSFYEIYKNACPKLIDFNMELIHLIRHYLDIQTPIIRSSEISGIAGEKNTKLISLCKALGADIYLSGEGAKLYMDSDAFQNSNIQVVYQNFDHPVYPQRWGTFIPNLSIIDLLFNCGSNAKQYISKQIIS